MSDDRERYQRRSIRLRGHDYALPGAYFVTVCTRDRACLFGHVANGEMHLNEAGEIAQRCWADIPDHFPFVELDSFVVMPNHVHAVAVVLGRGTACRAPTTEQFGKPSAGSIPTIIRSYKSAVTRHVNLSHGAPGTPLWQRNYYEHIVRNEADLMVIREYILVNPALWDDDENNPCHEMPQERIDRWMYR